MSGLLRRLSERALMSGPDRKALRDVMLEATDRARLRMALSDAATSRDYDDIVREAPYEIELDELIATALKQGWIRELIAVVKGMTSRADLIATVNAIDAAVADRIAGGAQAGDGSSRRFPAWAALCVPVLILALSGGLYLFVNTADPNYIVRLQEGDRPASARPVFVTELVAGDRAAPRHSTMTNAHGEAFFSLELGSNRIYMLGVKLGDASECTFPAFTVTEKREALYRLDSSSCLEVSDVLLRTVAPQQPTLTEDVLSNLPTDPAARAARAPLGLPAAPVVLDRLYYTLGFDPAIRSPRWVSFIVDTQKAFQIRREPDKFIFDPAMPDEWQTGEDVYRGNSYDRGTLVRRSDAAIGRFEQEAKASVAQVFYYSITIPQPDATNQKTWLAVEDYTSKLSSKVGPIHVIAGPIYPDLEQDNGAYLTLGESRTVVPSSVFRILLRKAADGEWRAIAFLVPNDGSLESDPKVFATSVSAVETSTGLNFFTAMSASEATALKANASLAEFER